MAKKQTQETYNDVSNRQNQTAAQYTAAANTNTANVGNLQGQTDADKRAYQNQATALTDLATKRQSDNADQAARDNGNASHEGTSGSSGLGGYNLGPVTDKIGTSDFNAPNAGYSELAQTGGYSPESRASLGSNIQGLKDIGATGGIDAASENRFRGGGVYDEFAQTGGYTPAQQANIKKQALSPIIAYRQNMSDSLATRRNVQGGYAPGFDATNRALSRDTSRNIADTSLNANIALQDKVNANRLTGAGGMASSESNLQGLKTGNMLTGLTQAGNQEMAMNNAIAQYRLQGLSGEESIARAKADIAGQNIGFDFQNQGNAQQLYLAGLGGLSNIYGTDVNQLTNAQNNQLALPGQAANAQQGYLGSRTNLATQPGVGGNIMRGIGTAAGIGSAFYNPTSSFKGVSNAGPFIG